MCRQLLPASRNMAGLSRHRTATLPFVPGCDPLTKTSRLQQSQTCIMRAYLGCCATQDDSDIRIAAVTLPVSLGAIIKPASPGCILGLRLRGDSSHGSLPTDERHCCRAHLTVSMLSGVFLSEFACRNLPAGICLSIIPMPQQEPCCRKVLLLRVCRGPSLCSLSYECRCLQFSQDGSDDGPSPSTRTRRFSGYAKMSTRAPW